MARTLIERSRIATTRPRVRSEDLLRAVGDGCWELATLEERNVETQVEHVLEAVVDVNPSALKKKRSDISGRGEKGRQLRKGRNFLQEILCPFEGIGVETVGVGGSPH